MNYCCSLCGKEYKGEELLWRCSCGGYLSCNTDTLLRKEDIIKDRYSLWRYEKVLPQKLDQSSVSLMEGFTPLVETGWENIKIYFKSDHLMPTGSFKDRGAVILINYFKRSGVKCIVEDSSGNAGAAMAAYCGAAGLECNIFVPASTSKGKLAQISLYGANVCPISGTREEVARAAVKASEEREDAFYGSHNWHPLFIEGTKTLAYEIWEQLRFSAPDNVIAPVGGGSSILGLYKGFNELLEAGEIAQIPRLFGIQSRNCSPLYHLFRGDSAGITPAPTIAEGIAIAAPVRGKEIVRAVDSTGGIIDAVSEEEIAAALKHAASKGFFVEPTTAVALAGASRLIDSGTISPEEKTVVILTGNGLKATEKIGRLMGITENEH